MRRIIREVGMAEKKILMPSDVSTDVGWFDRFADRASKLASRAWFFAFCVLLVVIWAPSYFLLGSVDTWQLIINTATTIITFLLVALLQNSQERSDQALHQKLNAIADSLADVMDNQDLPQNARELREAVGLENHESSDGR